MNSSSLCIHGLHWHSPLDLILLRFCSWNKRMTRQTWQEWPMNNSVQSCCLLFNYWTLYTMITVYKNVDLYKVGDFYVLVMSIRNPRWQHQNIVEHSMMFISLLLKHPTYCMTSWPLSVNSHEMQSC